jgi:hypothetical protein
MVPELSRTSIVNSTLKVKVQGPLYWLIIAYQTTRRHIAENCNQNLQGSEKHKYEYRHVPPGGVYGLM